jgi:hypothetical protein
MTLTLGAEPDLATPVEDSRQRKPVIAQVLSDGPNKCGQRRPQ